MSISRKLLIPSLSLSGIILLTLLVLVAIYSRNNIRQIELAKAESLKLVFNNYLNISDTQSTTLDNLKDKYQVNWQIFIRNTSAAEFEGANDSAETSIPNTDLRLRASSLDQFVLLPANTYIRALAGESSLAQISVPMGDTQQNSSVYSFPIRDETGNIIGVTDVFWDRNPFNVQQRNLLLLTLLVILALLVAGGLSMTRIMRQALAPLPLLVDHARRIGMGEYNLVTRPEGAGELAALGENLNTIASEMGKLSANLDLAVAERTIELEKRNRQIQSVAEISRQIAAPHHLDDLLMTTVRLIHERFEYYHVGIFLVDDQKQFAVLKAANDETGKLLIQSGHKLGIGQRGIVGFVTGKGEARIAADVTQDPAHYRNPILPYTRAEMALPLKTGGDVIGALDIQSTEIGAFTNEDVSILQTLADQLAVAVENTRLVEKLEASVEETRRLYKQQIEETWKHYTDQVQVSGYQYNRMQVLPAETSLPDEVKQPLKSGQVVIQNVGDSSEDKDGSLGRSVLWVPLSLRDQLIGVIGIEKDTPDHSWNVDELAIAQAAANQVSLTLENARLLEQTYQRAERERIAGQISARLRSSNDPQQILQTAVSELKQALRAQKTQVMLAPRSPEPGDGFQLPGDNHYSGTPEGAGNEN